MRVIIFEIKILKMYIIFEFFVGSFKDFLECRSIVNFLRESRSLVIIGLVLRFRTGSRGFGERIVWYVTWVGGGDVWGVLGVWGFGGVIVRRR